MPDRRFELHVNHRRVLDVLELLVEDGLPFQRRRKNRGEEGVPVVVTVSIGQSDEAPKAPRRARKAPIAGVKRG